MGTHDMMVICKDCKADFWMTIEHLDRAGLIRLAHITKCPHCGSPNWTLTDACER